MKRGMKITMVALLVVLVFTVVGGYLAHRELVGTASYDAGFYAAGAEPAAQDAPFTYDNYATVLNTWVDDKGMVDYRSLKENPGKLDSFLLAMARLDKKTYDTWDDPAKIAFWINAYNALTLKAIVDHYPIRAGFFSGLAYPKNSIRQIPGVWDKLQWLVVGEKVTLHEIEHAILRGTKNPALQKQFGSFNEPRIHVALVCAAKSCPRLRREPFVGKKLDEQLDDQSRTVVNNPEKFRVDRDAGTVYLSSIFKWFGSDFIKTYLPEKGFGNHGKAERAVLHYASKYLPARDAQYLRKGDFAVKYLDYDWSLNERKKD